MSLRERNWMLANSVAQDEQEQRSSGNRKSRSPLSEAVEAARSAARWREGDRESERFVVAVEAGALAPPDPRAGALGLRLPVHNGVEERAIHGHADGKALRDSLDHGRGGGDCAALIHLHHGLVLDIPDINTSA